jgi:hypothetical protein
MPWKKSEPMDQRREFALKALGTLNFRALCEEYGISPNSKLTESKHELKTVTVLPMS